MRVERKGNIEPLTPRWKRFLEEALSGQSLDSKENAETLRPDYSCLGGLLAVELKSLEEDASERMENLFDELRQRPDWPVFYGSAPVQAMLGNLQDGPEVHSRVINRIGRAVINHLKKANKQLRAHTEDNQRKSCFRLMVLVNEDHPIYEPHVVAYVVRHALLRQENGAPLYPDIDAVLYTSERHAMQHGSQIGFPIIMIEGGGIENALWKRDVADFVMGKWAKWSGIDLHFTDAQKVNEFVTVEHVPDQMARHEMWRLAYRRNPYLRGLSEEALRDKFDEANAVLTLMALKNAPIKPPNSSIEKAFILFTHVIEEMNKRGISAERFALEPSRLASAASRLRMPDVVVRWYENSME